MPIKWKKRTGLNPQTILDKIEDGKSVDEDGRVSYSAFDYHEAYASLFSMLDVPAAIDQELNVDSLVSAALGEAARAGILTMESVEKCLNEAARRELSTPERRYSLLTSISMAGDMPFRRLNIDSARLRVVDGAYPKKYDSRVYAIRGHAGRFSLEHRGYTKVILSTKAKSVHGAASKALNSLDLARAFLSLFSNSGMELMGDSYAPINKVRLGQVHTLHHGSGKAVADLLWFEPNFHETRPFKHRTPKTLRKNFHRCLMKLSMCGYRRTLVDSLLRYVRALDEKDHNSAAIRMWGALETLASPGDARYERIVKRCSFLFEEVEYHRQILEHLREFRNKSVHAGDQSDRAKTFCYQMQFYYRQLLLFHLALSGEFETLDEANAVLDLPTDKSQLVKKKAQVVKALKFRQVDT